MKITWRSPEDRVELPRRIAAEKAAKQRDRLRAVQLSLAGEEAPRIAVMLGRSRRFVQQWAYAYRDQGLEAVRAIPQRGQPTKLAGADEAQFKARMLGGPTAEDHGLCTLRGKDARRVLQDEFGQRYTLSGAYALLHRVGLSCLVPRPKHRQNDPAAMQQWLERAPFLSRPSVQRTRTKRSKSGSRTKRGSDSRER